MATRVEVPGLGIVEFPDGMSEADMKSAIKKGLEKKRLDTAGETVASTVRDVGRLKPEATFDNMLANAFQGMTLGYGDEIVAAGRDLFGIQDYDDALADHRGLVEEGQRADPTAAFLLEMGGGVLLPGFGIGKAAQAGTKLGKIGGLMGIGGATGAVTGFGASEGGLDERLKGAAWGGGLGAVATPALVAGAGALGRAGQAVADITGIGGAGRADKLANQQINRALADTVIDPLTGNKLASGLTPDTAGAALDTMRAAGATPALADLGQGVARKASAAGRVPGEAGDILTNFVETRQGAQADRMTSVFDGIFGGGKTAARFVDDLSDHQKAVAGPLYQQAMQSQAKVDTTPLVIEIAGELKDAVGTREANLKKLLGYLRREMMDGTASLKDDIASLHQVKLGIDDLIDKAHTESGIGRAGQRVLVRLKKQLLGLMDGADSNYKAARAEWAGDAALKEAAEQGQDFLKMSPEEVARLWGSPTDGGLSKSEREAFKVGVLDAIKQAINGAGDGRNKVLTLFGSPQARDRLQAILGPDDFQRLTAYMQAEKLGAKTNQKLVGGSITAERLADDKAMSGGSLKDLLDGILSPESYAGKKIGQLGGISRGMNSQTAANIVQRLAETDPEGVAKILQALRAQAAKDAARAANPALNPRSYGIGLGGVGLPSWLMGN